MSQQVPESSKQVVALQPDDSTTMTFWHSFSVFLWPFERFCVRRWYILLIVFFVIKFVAALARDLVLYLQYYDIWTILRYGYVPSDFFYDAFNNWFNVLTVGIFLTLGLTYRWQRSIPRFFQTLGQRYHLTNPQSETTKTYQSYLAEYRRALRYGKGRVLSRPVVVAVVVLCSSAIPSIWFFSYDLPYIMSPAPVSGIAAAMQGLWLFEVDFFFPLLQVYLLVTIVWMMVATGLYIRRFVERFPLQIQLTHPDHCGGFKFVGDFMLNIALILLTGAILYVLYIMWRGVSVASVGATVLFLLLVISSYWAFFAPVLAVQRSILKERSAYEDTIAGHTVALEGLVKEALRDGDRDRLNAAREELEELQALSPSKLRFPNGPFSWRTLITFFNW